MARAKKKTQDVMDQIAEQMQEADMTVETVIVDEEDMVISEEESSEGVAEETAEQPAEESVEEVSDAPAEDLILSVEDVRLVEAMLFASSSALSVSQMAERFPADRVSLIPDALEHLREQYASRGVNLVQRDNRWALRTATDLGDQLRLEKEQPKKFTRAAMETMAVIAYHQPVTRAEIENIRGVATSPGALDALMEAGWIKPGKRREVPGRPVTWLSTQAFLDHFGLEKLADLPGMDELKAAGLLDKRPAIEAMPTPDLFDGENAKEEDDPQTVTDEDLIGDSGITEDEMDGEALEVSETTMSSSDEDEDEDGEEDFDDEESDDEDSDDIDESDDDSDDDDEEYDDEDSDESDDDEDSDDDGSDDDDEDEDEDEDRE